MNFYNWQIKDANGNTKKELKLRLTAREATMLEDTLGGNPINDLIAMETSGKIPTTRYIATTLKASLQSMEHGYGEDEVFDLIDSLTEDGYTRMDMLKPLMECFKVSGFFKGPGKKK